MPRNTRGELKVWKVFLNMELRRSLINEVVDAQHGGAGELTPVGVRLRHRLLDSPNSDNPTLHMGTGPLLMHVFILVQGSNGWSQPYVLL